MTGSSPKFPNCDRYQPSGLSLGQELPNNAYISGKIVLLWSMKAGAYQLRFSISAKYQTNVTNSDYVSTSDKGTEKWKFNISLNPLAANIKSGQTIQQTVEAEHEAMLPYLASEIKIATDGLKVIKIDGKDVGLEGTGSRMMWTESRGTWTVFQGKSKSKSKLKGTALKITQNLLNLPILHLGSIQILVYLHHPALLPVLCLKLDLQTTAPSVPTLPLSLTYAQQIAQSSAKEPSRPKKLLSNQPQNSRLHRSERR
jgi:hypothetical protein